MSKDYIQFLEAFTTYLNRREGRGDMHKAVKRREEVDLVAL
jgi:hypothetical protein